MPRLLQISDTHLLADSKQLWRGINTQATLEAVLHSAILQQPDWVVLSGDLSQDGSLASYQRLAQTLAILPCPIYWIPGNHDEIANAQAGLVGKNIRPEKVIVTENWQIILLDSIAPGLKDGFLGDLDFAHLQHCLQTYPQKAAMLVLHHPPLHIGCYMDEIRLINDEAFLTLIADYPQVQAVLFGHIHQAFEQQQAGVFYAGVPSTCLQFQPKKTQFAIDSALTPGYRWVEFIGQHFTSAIIRI